MNCLYDGSSGGGVSTSYAQPWYQKNVVPTRLAETEVTSTPITYDTGTTAFGTLTLAYNESLTRASSPMRVTPDVSALADPSTGVAVGETLFGPDNAKGVPGPEKFYLSRIGGTSVASPDLRGHRGGRPAGGRVPARLRQPGDLLAGRPEPSAYHNVVDNPGGATFYEVRSNYTDAVQRDPPAGDLPAHAGRGRLHRPQRHLPGGPGGRAWRRVAGPSRASR